MRGNTTWHLQNYSVFDSFDFDEDAHVMDLMLMLEKRLAIPIQNQVIRKCLRDGKEIELPTHELLFPASTVQPTVIRHGGYGGGRTKAMEENIGAKRGEDDSVVIIVDHPGPRRKYFDLCLETTSGLCLRVPDISLDLNISSLQWKVAALQGIAAASVRLVHEGKIVPDTIRVGDLALRPRLAKIVLHRRAKPPIKAVVDENKLKWEQQLKNEEEQRKKARAAMAFFNFQSNYQVPAFAAANRADTNPALKPWERKGISAEERERMKEEEEEDRRLKRAELAEKNALEFEANRSQRSQLHLSSSHVFLRTQKQDQQDQQDQQRPHSQQPQQQSWVLPWNEPMKAVRITRASSAHQRR